MASSGEIDVESNIREPAKDEDGSLNAPASITIIREKWSSTINDRQSADSIPELKIETTKSKRYKKTTETKTKKGKKIKLEKTPREAELLNTLRETIYFAIFGFLVTLVCIGMVNSSMYNMTKVMKEQIVEANSVEKATSASSFWVYLQKLFTASFYWDYWYEPEPGAGYTTLIKKKVLYENKLLGLIRMRQLKVLSSSCEVHPLFKKIIKVCYGPFSSRYEDKESFGKKTGTAWVWNPPDRDESPSLSGPNGYYHGGGYYVDFPLVQSEALEVLEYLRNNLWITRGTRVIFIEFAVYNSNMNLFCVIRIVFEFPATGGIIIREVFRTVKLIRYDTIWDHFFLGCEGISSGFLIYYTYEEFRRMKQKRLNYLCNFWTYINLLILGCGYAAMVLSLVRVIIVHRRLNILVRNQHKFSGLEVAADQQSTFNYLLAMQLFCIYIKIFKYLNFNKSMAQLNNTLKRCRKDVAGFGLMFFVIFIAFSILGFLLFGTEVTGFSSFYIAMFTLLRTILGDFNYIEINEANRVLAPVFFVSFIFLVFFVLLNMFLAIINDTYTDVKTEIEIAPDVLQITGLLVRGIENFLRRFGCGKLVRNKKERKLKKGDPSSQINEALKLIGFDEMEIQMFFQRFNIDPDAKIQDYNVDELLDALEGRKSSKAEAKKTTEDGKPLVSIDDFMDQQQRLDQIDQSISTLTHTLNLLLDRLQTLETVRKIRHKFPPPDIV